MSRFVQQLSLILGFPGVWWTRGRSQISHVDPSRPAYLAAMVDRAEWLRLYTQFLEVEEELHQALPTVTEQMGGGSLAAGLKGVDLDRTAALIEVMRQRWVRFQEFAEH